MAFDFENTLFVTHDGYCVLIYRFRNRFDVFHYLVNFLELVVCLKCFLDDPFNIVFCWQFGYSLAKRNDRFQYCFK